MDGPIFIIGCGRTGSNLLEQILNNHSEIKLVPEMHFMTFWKKGLTDRLDKIGTLKKDKNLQKAVELMYSGKLIGDYWSKIDIDKRKLYEKFSDSDRSYRALMEIIMKEHAKKNEKTHYGAKFPVHFSYLPTLFEWFPNAKSIHMIRDPRAIYASELKKDEKPNFPLKKKNPFYAYEILLYVLFQWKWAAKSHRCYKNRYADKYRICKFEDLILEPESTIEDICNFLEVDFEPEVLDVIMRGSSFEDSKDDGFKKEPLYRWKKTVSPLKKKVIRLILGSHMSDLKYL